ncbi:MAG: hypothetical protein BGO67_03630 [Alphaproteobacteria bacterium 41-28]|nr:MAG: hypothetical protein BGO67_03630 [Alphaproteobacteria bacterium 41-28]
MKNFLTLISFLLFLSGCTHIPSYNFSVPDIVSSKQKVNADLKNITISYGEPDAVSVVSMRLDELSKEQLSQEVIPAWAVALYNALKRSELFDKSSEKKVNLSVSIQEINVPSFGIDFTTYVLANYKLNDIATNTTLYNDTVKSEETVPFNYSFAGYKRANESINRAVRKNISTFISNIQNHKPF